MALEFLEDNAAQQPVAQNESGLGYLGRTAGRTLARAGETVAGMPGDIANLPTSALSYLIRGLMGEPPRPLPQNLNERPQGPLSGTPAEELLQSFEEPTGAFNLPTSAQLRETVTKPLTGEYLEPQTSGEENWDDIVSTAASLLVPGEFAGGGKAIAKKVASAFGKSAAGNMAKWAAESVTDSPLIGEAAKIGTIALAGTAGGRKKLEAFKEDNYNKAFEKLPENATINIEPQRKKLLDIYDKIKTSDTNGKNFIQDRIKAFETLPSERNNIKVSELIDLKKGWNSYFHDNEVPKSVQGPFKKMIGQLLNGIEGYGKQNPGFYKPWKTGEELTAALNSSNAVQKYIQQYPKIQKAIENPFIATLLTGAPSVLAGKISPYSVGTAAGLGIYEGAKVYQLLAKSPAAQRFYKKLITDALKQNTPAVIHDIHRLNKEAEKHSLSKETENILNQSQELPSGFEFVEEPNKTQELPSGFEFVD